jgi:hypothetical protein
VLFCGIALESFSHNQIKERKRCPGQRSARGVLAGFVDVGLRPIQNSKIDRRPAVILNAKESGTERNVQNGTKIMLIISGPTIFRRNWTL